MFFFFSNRGEDEEEETKQLLEFDAGSSFVNVVAVNWSTRKFVPLPRSVPHDNRGNLWPAHVSHFMTVSSYTSATSTTGGPESKETKQGPKLGFYKHRHMSPKKKKGKICRNW
jgi:hypothetical protein